MSGYTRTNGMPQNGRDSTIPRFHVEAVEDPLGTAQAGRPIFKQQERVQIIQPGNSNSPVELVRQEHIERWPEHYAAFRAGQDFVTDGTPLEQWPLMKKNMVMELKALGIHSVEQIAALSDTAIQKIGMGGRALVDNAKAYLDDSAAMSIVSEAIALKEKFESEVLALRSANTEMRALMDQMHSELMALKNAPHPIATYTPGMHDPVQIAQQSAPPPIAATSSLDAMAVRRRPRGQAEAAA